MISFIRKHKKAALILFLANEVRGMVVVAGVAGPLWKVIH